MVNFFTAPLSADDPELPFFSAYARKIEVNTDTLIEWRSVHPSFSVAYKKCKELQKEVLAKYGLNGGFNATFSVFTAKNILGWRDVQEIKQEIKAEYDISPALADMFNKMYQKGEK